MAERLRVLLLIPHLGGGGAEQVTALLARGLSNRKYEIHLGLVTQAAPTSAALQGVTVHALGASRVRYGAAAILKLVRRLRPNVILSGMAHLNFMVLMLRRLFPKQTLIFVRQNSTVSSALAAGALPWYTRRLYRALYCRADRIICQSRAMADDLAAEVGIAAERLAVLPNPVDLDGIQGVTEPERWPGFGPHLLALGRLVPEKGFDLLLRALALVRRDFPHADLVIAGTGPEDGTLKRLADELGLKNAVWFAGHVDQPCGFYAGANLFVLSSRHEGMPNVLIEALASGLPVVATPASGGVVNLLQRRANSWLARDASVEGLKLALAQALKELEPETFCWDWFGAGPEDWKPRLSRLSPAAIVKPVYAAAQDGAEPQRYIEFVGEFDFDRAFEAYEALIDSTCAGCRA